MSRAHSAAPHDSHFCWLREAVNRLLEESFISPARFEPLFSREAPLDLFETDGEYIVEVTLPGVKDEDLKLTLRIG